MLSRLLPDLGEWKLFTTLAPNEARRFAHALQVFVSAKDPSVFGTHPRIRLRNVESLTMACRTRLMHRNCARQCRHIMDATIADKFINASLKSYRRVEETMKCTARAKWELI